MTTHNKSKRKSSNQVQSARRNLIAGSLIATLIALTPYIFYSYENVPDTAVWDNFLFTFESKFYQDANAAAWVVMMKFLPLLLLFIWFFTCRHWWYHALLVPIGMFSFQLIGVLVDETGVIDELHLIYMLPMMAIIVPSIYLIRAKLFNKMNSNKSLQELEEEFTLRPKNLLSKFKDYF